MEGRYGTSIVVGLLAGSMLWMLYQIERPKLRLPAYNWGCLLILFAMITAWTMIVTGVIMILVRVT